MSSFKPNVFRRAYERVMKNFSHEVIRRFIRKTFSKMFDEELELIVHNIPYERVGLPEPRVPKMATMDELLRLIVEERKSIARFGDYEFNLCQGWFTGYQDFDPVLQQRLCSILHDENDACLTCIPDTFAALEQYPPHVVSFWRRYMFLHREKVYAFLNFDKTYYDAFISRTKTAEHYEKLKRIWKDRDLVLIEGDQTRLGVGNDLFAGAKRIRRILAPAKDAFSRLEDLKAEALKCDKEVLFLISMGAAATVLAYDLAQAGYQALDMGHVDIFYEWLVSGEEKPVRGKYVNELRKGRVYTVCNDPVYQSQIIARFTEARYPSETEAADSGARV